MKYTIGKVIETPSSFPKIGSKMAQVEVDGKVDRYFIGNVDEHHIPIGSHALFSFVPEDEFVNFVQAVHELGGMGWE
jgi:hypothetical protein